MNIPIHDIISIAKKYSLSPLKVERIPHGLVNETFKFETALGEKYVLQRLNPIFNAMTNETTHLVTAFLGERGFLTPSLVTTTEKEISVRFEQRIWRLFTYIEGVVFQKISNPDIASSAGKILAKFHSLMQNFKELPLSERLQVHDFEGHLNHFRFVFTEHEKHRLFSQVKPLYRRLDSLVRSLTPFDLGPTWIVHGDPKISNIMFSDTSLEAICMLDFDTIARMPVLLELGDAMRSWCNPLGEDSPNAYFDTELYRGALDGYQGALADKCNVFSSEQILSATIRIFLELASRFLSDALEERYFGWDPLRYDSRGDHNLIRAESQISAAESMTQLVR